MLVYYLQSADRRMSRIDLRDVSLLLIQLKYSRAKLDWLSRSGATLSEVQIKQDYEYSLGQADDDELSNVSKQPTL